MQYVWQNRLWPTHLCVATDGRRINILHPGTLNTDAGPDFSNASIKIDDQYWCGNIEIHVRASDWFRHGHHTDPAYDTVILHVVEVSDADIYRSNGEKIPQLVMACARDFSERYDRFLNNPSGSMPCAAEIPQIPPLHLSDCITALGMQRLQEKADRVSGLARERGWSEALYITLARSLGFGTNSDPFELLAKTTPLRALRRHSDDLQAIEAMLFGQAGMLTAEIADCDYLSILRREYAFYSAKYGLSPSPNIQWKMARMRPQNSPHRRIATLALLVGGGFSFSHDISRITDAEQARGIFRELSHQGFWSSHCNFASLVGGSPRALAESSIDILIINAIIPYIYAYGEYADEPALTERATDMLYSLRPERNSLVAPFMAAGLPVSDAFTSQALIHLSKNYCRPRNCLHCRLGHRLLSSMILC